MPYSLLLLALPLVGCGAERGLRDAPTEVTYGGWVYDSPRYEGVLALGDLTFTLPSDVAPEPVAAEQPYEGYEGYWLATLPPGVPFQLGVSSDNAYPTVWAGDSPGANGTWFVGAVFAAETTYVDALFAGLDLPEGTAPGALADGAVHLWGTAYAGEWDCSVVTVNGTAPFCYVLAEDGTLARVTTGPFDMFFAFDLAPGEIVVEDGFGGREAWTADPGDLVMAWWMVRG
ncbi:MAG: hypothetical protein Q8P41_20655 [Pseudomonadota bacterium]|nr:hypothetical protein [Pseudomonadota bacterium]